MGQRTDPDQRCWWCGEADLFGHARDAFSTGGILRGVPVDDMDGQAHDKGEGRTDAGEPVATRPTWATQSMAGVDAARDRYDARFDAPTGER
ncbi:hypothetical protein SAMN05880545_1935 [Microbacterium sp. RU33B]|nr:hypothetical protein SAMN05880545_1935 [Microbacterium sp. RU33B]